MQLKTFEIFTKKADEYYNSLVSTIKNYTDVIDKIEMTPQEVQQKQLDIFNSLYKWPVFIPGEPKNDIRSAEISNKEAGDLIGNGFSYSVSRATSLITELESLYIYSGGTDSLQISVQYYKRSVRGKLTPSNLTLLHHFQGTDTSEAGKVFKQEKESLINLLEQNSNEVGEFFNGKKNSFLAMISLKIEEKLAANKKRIEDLNSF